MQRMVRTRICTLSPFQLLGRRLYWCSSDIRSGHPVNGSFSCWVGGYTGAATLPILLATSGRSFSCWVGGYTGAAAPGCPPSCVADMFQLLGRRLYWCSPAPPSRRPRPIRFSCWVGGYTGAATIYPMFRSSVAPGFQLLGRRLYWCSSCAPDKRLLAFPFQLLGRRLYWCSSAACAY